MVKVALAENIYWVGVVDWNLRDFHGFTTRRGTTYNAYLIQDEKTALIDTVKYMYPDILLEHIQEVTDPEKIDRLSRLMCAIGEELTQASLKVAKKYWKEEATWTTKIIYDGENLESQVPQGLTPSNPSLE